MHRIIAGICLMLLVTACGQEAGYEVDTGNFGNATMNNTLVMTGSRDYAMAVARRFEEEVPSTVNFEFNKSNLDAEARQILDRQADWIGQFPEIRFRVFGYTDNVGTVAYNQSLGMRRAQTVARYLTSRHGIDRSRLEAVVSYGKTRPLIDRPGPERANRRAITEVAGFVARHPTVMDGKYAEVIYREYIASAVPPSTLSGFKASSIEVGQQ